MIDIADVKVTLKTYRHIIVVNAVCSEVLPRYSMEHFTFGMCNTGTSISLNHLVFGKSRTGDFMDVELLVTARVFDLCGYVDKLSHAIQRYVNKHDLQVQLTVNGSVFNFTKEE